MFRVSGFKSQVSGFGFKVTSGMGLRGWGVGEHLLVAVWHVEQNLCFGFRVSGFGFRVSGSPRRLHRNTAGPILNMFLGLHREFFTLPQISVADLTPLPFDR